MNLYIIRNKEGKYFRSKGRSGYGENWVDEIEIAKIYQKIGPARAIVSFYTNNYPGFDRPELLRLEAQIVEVIDEKDRVEKQKRKKEERELAQKIENDKWELKLAEEKLAITQKLIDKLKKG